MHDCNDDDRFRLYPVVNTEWKLPDHSATSAPVKHGVHIWVIRDCLADNLYFIKKLSAKNPGLAFIPNSSFFNI